MRKKIFILLLVFTLLLSTNSFAREKNFNPWQNGGNNKENNNQLSEGETSPLSTQGVESSTNLFSEFSLYLGISFIALSGVVFLYSYKKNKVRYY